MGLGEEVASTFVYILQFSTCNHLLKAFVVCSEKGSVRRFDSLTRVDHEGATDIRTIAFVPCSEAADNQVSAQIVGVTQSTDSDIVFSSTLNDRSEARINELLSDLDVNQVRVLDQTLQLQKLTHQLNTFSHTPYLQSKLLVRSSGVLVDNFLHLLNESVLHNLVT